MSKVDAVATTYAYRQKVAKAAANGTAISKIAYMAFGTGSRAYTLDDTSLEREFKRVAVSTHVTGVQLIATATLKGQEVGAHVLREVGVFTADGTLVGRRVIAPKEFEPETEMDFEITFQY